jgi:predicted O-methyltransferase YrrM
MLVADAIAASRNSEALLSAGEQTLLYQLAREVPAGGTIVELGSWMGGSTIMLAAGSLSGPRAKVSAVDCFALISETSLEYADRVPEEGPDYFARFQSNIRRAGVESVVEPIRSLTTPAARAWQGPPIDLLFIDANHYYEDVARDFIEWAVHCAVGSICVFHDYERIGAPGVRKFVDRAIARGLLKDVEFVDSIAYGRLTTTDRGEIEGRLKYRLRDLLRLEKDRESWFIFSNNHAWMALGADDRRLAFRYALQTIRWKPLRKSGWILLACVVLNRKPGGSKESTGRPATG